MARLQVQVITDGLDVLFSEWVEVPEDQPELMPVSALLEATSVALFKMRGRELLWHQ